MWHWLDDGIFAVYLHRKAGGGRVLHVGIASRDAPWQEPRSDRAPLRDYRGGFRVEIVRKFKSSAPGAWARAKALQLQLRLRYGLLKPDERRHPHGSLPRYQHYHCRCERCRRANTALHRRMKGNRIARPIAERVKHGSRSTYINWRCRCDACTEAQRKYNARVYRRRNLSGADSQKKR